MSTPAAPAVWPHEGTFLGAAQALASSVYDELDPTLRPQVRAVRLVATGGVGGFKPQGIVPDAGTLPGDFMIAIAERAATVIAALPPHPGAAGARARVLEGWRQSIQEVLAAQPSSSELVSFAGEGRSVDGGAIVPVLQLSRRAWEAYYSLRRGAADLRTRRPVSLLDAVSGEFLRRLSSSLIEAAERDQPPTLDNDPEEVLATSGRLLADTPALGEGSELILRGLFQTCNTLAALPYEGAQTAGRMIVSRPSYPGLVRRITLVNPVRLNDIPAVRKLLVTAASGMALLSDGGSVYGLGGLDMNRSVPSESLFHIAFLKRSTWELARGLRTLMRVTYGRPRLPRMPISEARFRFYVTRTFGLLPEPEFEALWGLALAASEQKKGTILVISKAARQEAERLAFQGLSVTPVALEREALLSVSSIDGAVLIGPDATCFAIGAILDGRSQGTGDPARGARYNSALRYVLSSDVPCLAVVVSEDGRVDLLCK
jgi:hypothetical protein